MTEAGDVGWALCICSLSFPPHISAGQRLSPLPLRGEEGTCAGHAQLAPAAWDPEGVGGHTLATGSFPASSTAPHRACLSHSRSRCHCPWWPSWSSDTSREEFFLAVSASFCLSRSLAQASRGGVLQLCSLAEVLLLSQYLRERGFSPLRLSPPAGPACVTPAPAPGSIPFGSPFSSSPGECLRLGAGPPSCSSGTHSAKPLPAPALHSCWLYAPNVPTDFSPALGHHPGPSPGICHQDSYKTSLPLLPLKSLLLAAGRVIASHKSV